VFRWTLQPPDIFLFAPFFGPDGLTYFGGLEYFLTGYATLLPTTPNALLTAPCDTRAGVVAALSSQGEVRFLSYLPIGLNLSLRIRMAPFRSSWRRGMPPQFPST
jgi:hypothetical protein